MAHEAGSTTATRSWAGTALISSAAAVASSAVRTSKPSARRSASSGDPATGGPVRMAVDRRTHSLDADKAAPVGPHSIRTTRAAGVAHLAPGRPGGTSAEAIGSPDAAVHRAFTARSSDRRLRLPRSSWWIGWPMNNWPAGPGPDPVPVMRGLVTGRAGCAGAGVVRSIPGPGRVPSAGGDTAAGRYPPGRGRRARWRVWTISRQARRVTGARACCAAHPLCR